MDSFFPSFQQRCTPWQLFAQAASPLGGPIGTSTLNVFSLRAAASASASASGTPLAVQSQTEVNQLAPPSNTTGLPTPTVDSSEPLLKLELEQGPQRYAAYAMRLKTVLASSSRYVAYSSDIGEAFRPLTRPEVVRAAYGISWLYLIGDVSYAGYKAAKQHESQTRGDGLVESAEKTLQRAAQKVGIDRATLDKLTPSQKDELRKRHGGEVAGMDVSRHGEATSVGLVMARRAVFQSIASMALPALTIHSIVRYTAPLFAKSSRPRIRAAGPTVAGLAFVPALPFMFDEPVEHVVDLAFDWVQEAFFGQKQEATIEAAKKKLQ